MVSNNGAPVKILQITDTHLFADDTGRLMGIDTAWTFQAVIKAIVDSDRTHDAVIVTGDLSQDESKESYLNLAAELKKLNAAAYCLPGNHDQGDGMKLAFAEATNISADRSFIVGNWQIVLLNTAERKKVSGHLRESELSWLDNCLAAFPEHHALIAMHHQPVPVGSTWMDGIALDNPKDLFSVLDAHKQVRGIIFGHVHQQFEGMRNDVKLMSSPSTCVQFEPGCTSFTVDAAMPGYRWLRLHSDGRIETGVERISNQEIGLDRNSPGY